MKTTTTVGEITVELNGTVEYSTANDDAAEIAWTRLARAMKFGDELVMRAGGRIHRASSKQQAG